MAEGKNGASDVCARGALDNWGALLRHHAETRGNKVGMWFEGESFTFEEMNRRACQVANGLAAAGTSQRERVCHIGKNDARFFDILGGCAKSNRVLSPINWRLAPPEVIDLICDFDIRVLFLSAEMEHLAKTIRPQCPQVHTIIGIGAAIGDTPEFDEWLAAQSDIEPDAATTPDDVVLQIHTSGTTGRPKGAMLTHGNILSIARHAETGDVGVWSEADVNLVPLPLFHSGGTCYALYGIYVGASTYLLREPRPELIIDACGRRDITRAGLVPAVIQMLLNHPEFDSAKMCSLRCVYYGGSPITAALLEQAMVEMGCGFHQLFGMTETTTAGTSLMPEDHDLSRPELLKSCGRAQSDTEIRIVDASRKDLPRGETGEIVLRTPCVMKGYYNQPQATAQSIIDGWYYTGDVGYLTDEGFLYVRDRLKDMVISGGENIYPAEIEQALARHPAVLECGVIGIPSAKWGEEVRACVVLRAGQQVSEDEIIAHCHTLLAGFKCPKSVDFFEVLPRNANGKMLKRVLREPYWAGIERQVG